MDTTTRSRSLLGDDTDAAIGRRDRLRAAIARLGGHCDWRVDSAGWVVTLHLPEERTFVGPTLEAALSACVVWLAPPLTPVAPAYGPGGTGR